MKKTIFWQQFLCIYLCLFASISTVSAQTKQLIWQTPQLSSITNGNFTTLNEELTIELTLVGINNVNPENFVVSTHLSEPAQETSGQSKFTTTPLSMKGYKFKKTINLKPGTQLMRVIYKDVTGDIAAQPLRINLRQSDNVAGNSGNLYILSIGTATNLRYTVKDACNFGNAFRQQGNGGTDFLYQKVYTDMLLCKDATATNIKKKFERIGETNAFNNGKKINPEDVLIIYLSSHGFREGNEYFILGSDADHSAPRSTSVPYSFILERLAQLPCKKLMFIDACQSHLYQSQFQEFGDALTKIHSQHKGFAVFTSSSPSEYSVEDTEWMNGAFTYALLDGLKGAADAAPRGDENGQISIIELRDYLMGRVPALLHELGSKSTQNPQLIQNDFGHHEFFLTKHAPKGKEAYCPITCEASGSNLIGIYITDINGIMDNALSQKLADELNRQGLRARAVDGYGIGNSYVNYIMGKTNVVKKGEKPLGPDVKTTEYDAILKLSFSVPNQKGELAPCSERFLNVLFTDDSGVVNKIINKSHTKLLEEFKKIKPLPLCR